MCCSCFIFGSSWGGLKQQGPCKLKVGGRVPPGPSGSAAYGADSKLGLTLLRRVIRHIK